MRMQLRLSALVVICMILSGALSVNAATLLVANLFEPNLSDGRIEIVNTDGTGRQLLREVGGGLRGVAFDAEAQHLYWSDVNADQIVRISVGNLTEEPGSIVTENIDHPQDIQLSQAPKKLFWTDTIPREISASNVDGSDPTHLFSGLATTIALDTVNQKVYAENRSTASRGSIVRFDYDGSNLETVVSDVPTATSLAVDPVHEYVFWTSSAGLSNGEGGVYRVNFDGTDFREIFLMGSGLDTGGIAVDSDYVYWGQATATDRYDIFRMKLDGSSPEAVSLAYGNISAMVLVPDFPEIPITAVIDIKPGNERNVINPRSNGQVWVAVLSDTATPFDPLQTDISTVHFGPGDAGAVDHKVKDVNMDGVGDLLLRFKIAETGISGGDTEASLSGKTYHGQEFNGTDSITTVGR